MSKISGPDLVTILNGHPYLSGVWSDVDLRTDTKKTCVLIEIGLHALSMLTILNSMVNVVGGDIYDQFLRERIFTLIMSKIFTWAPKIMRKMAMGTIWICLLSCTSFVFHILQEVGAEVQVSF